MKYAPLFLLITSCAGAQHTLEVAQAKIDEARALAAEADAKRNEVCAAALDNLRAVEAIAPYVCGLVATQPSAPPEVVQTCAHAGDLPKAVRNVELACRLR